MDSMSTKRMEIGVIAGLVLAFSLGFFFPFTAGVDKPKCEECIQATIKTVEADIVVIDEYSYYLYKGGLTATPETLKRCGGN